MKTKRDSVKKVVYEESTDTFILPKSLYSSANSLWILCKPYEGGKEFTFTIIDFSEKVLKRSINILGENGSINRRLGQSPKWAIEVWESGSIEVKPYWSKETRDIFDAYEHEPMYEGENVFRGNMGTIYVKSPFGWMALDNGSHEHLDLPSNIREEISLCKNLA